MCFTIDNQEDDLFRSNNPHEQEEMFGGRGRARRQERRQRRRERREQRRNSRKGEDSSTQSQPENTASNANAANTAIEAMEVSEKQEKQTLKMKASAGFQERTTEQTPEIKQQENIQEVKQTDVATDKTDLITPEPTKKSNKIYYFIGGGVLLLLVVALVIFLALRKD